MTGLAGRARELRARREIEQGLAEMVGLVRGVIADGVVSSDEAEHLAEWTRAHPEVVTRWPANILSRRLERIFLDGRVDRREKKHLGALLSQLAEDPAGYSGGFPLATDVPLTTPEQKTDADKGRQRPERHYAGRAVFKQSLEFTRSLDAEIEP